MSVIWCDLCGRPDRCPEHPESRPVRTGPDDWDYRDCDCTTATCICIGGPTLGAPCVALVTPPLPPGRYDSVPVSQCGKPATWYAPHDQPLQRGDFPWAYCDEHKPISPSERQDYEDRQEREAEWLVDDAAVIQTLGEALENLCGNVVLYAQDERDLNQLIATEVDALAALQKVGWFGDAPTVPKGSR